MRDLVARPFRIDDPPRDPARLFYRRAVGLEALVRPEETWAQLDVGRAGASPGGRIRLDRDDARLLFSMTRWRSPEELGVSPAQLWRWVEADLLFFAPERPEGREVELTGESRVLPRARDEGLKVARRVSAWPTLAVEDAVQIAPMPFMPRGRDLVGAELVGLRLVSFERGREVFGATITGKRSLGARLRRLLPLLDGRRELPGVLDAFPRGERAEAEKLLHLLDDLTMLEVRPGPPDPAEAWERPAPGGQVTWLGHAAVLLQLAGKNVLVDPLIFARSEPEERWLSSPRPDLRALPRIDLALITHGDNDHLNAAALSMLPPETPIYVPRTAIEVPPYQVDMRGMLRVLGFTQVLEVEPGTRFSVDGVRVEVLPFEGESWGLPLAKVTYLVEAAETSCYLSADATFMQDTYEYLAARERKVQLAFLGVSGNAETYVMPPGFGYGDFYADWVPSARRNEWAQHCAGPREAARAAALFRPRHAFGYAAGGASFIRTEYSDTGDHAALAALLEAARLEAPDATRPVALPLGRPVAFAELGSLPSGA